MPRRPAPLPALIAIVAAIVVALAAPLAVTAADNTSLSDAQRDTLQRYARDTWASFVAMTDPDTGLPADSLAADGTRSVQTSTTNIGAYMWSTLVAEALGIIHHDEAVERLTATLSSLETMERHEPSGQFYNWYDHTTGEKLTVWPPSGDPLTPILSSVDNGWLAPASRSSRTAVPEVADRAERSSTAWTSASTTARTSTGSRSTTRPSTGASPCCYDTIVSESRIASYIGIAKGELPAKEYFGAWRTFPDTCDWSWQETKPVGFKRTYFGVDVFEGAYRYVDFRVVPGWGGSMFEALMPALFVPEEQWGPRSWAINHPLTVAAQIHHGLVDAEYGYWGFSPANIPEGGYTDYGVDAHRHEPARATHRTTTKRSSITASRAARDASRSPIHPFRIHQRRRDAARGVPGAALGA